MKKLAFWSAIFVLVIIFFVSVAIGSPQLMQDTREFSLKTDGKEIVSNTVKFKASSEGKVIVSIIWQGDAPWVEAKLYASKDNTLIVEKTGVSPLKLEFECTQSFLTDHGDDLYVIVTPQGGIAEGTIQTNLPVRKQVPVIVRELIDKGELLTKRLAGLPKKDQGVTTPVITNLKAKKEPQSRISIINPNIRITNGKTAVSKLQTVNPVKMKLPKKISVTQPPQKYAFFRMELTGNDLKVVTASVLNGPATISPMANGDLFYEVTDGKTVYSNGFFPDPRFTRVYMPDGSVREGFWPEKPVTFKVILNGPVLKEETMKNLGVNLYKVPGELRIRKIDQANLPVLRKNFKLIHGAAPGILHKTALQIKNFYQ